MALHWDISKVVDYRGTCYIPDPKAPDDRGEDRLNPVTEVLIFRAMTVGMPVITQANYVEFYLRCRTATEVFGLPLYRHNEGEGFEKYDVTLDDVEAHIGLSTNASTIKLRDFFTKSHQHILSERERSAKRKAEVAA